MSDGFHSNFPRPRHAGHVTSPPGEGGSGFQPNSRPSNPMILTERALSTQRSALGLSETETLFIESVLATSTRRAVAVFTSTFS